MSLSRSTVRPALLAAALALAFGFSCSSPAKDASGMNLLLITLDTTRADAVGLYSGRDDITPRIDELGRTGVWFEQCYTPVPLTLPAHASLFTGRDPIAHLVRNNGTYVLGEDERTMAEVFRDRGHRTSAVVSSFTVASKFGLSRGFEHYDEGFESGSAFLNFHTEIPADRVTEKFVQWLDRRPEGSFFSWVHFFDPHFPYLEHPGHPGPGPASSWDLYLGEVRFMDAHVGKIVDELRARSLYENTVIVIVGDHGEAFGEHGEYGHGIFCYEESLLVPLVIHSPRLFPSARVVPDRVGLIDIMPTVLEMYGFRTPEAVQGRSFTAALDGRKGKPGGPLYFESLFGQEENNWAPLTGLIDGRYKYISLPEPELYDLEQDGGETRNLVAERPEIARELDRRLREFILKHGSSRPAGRRTPSESDLQRLTALGYVSAFSGQAKDMIDPKTAIGIYAEVAEIKAVVGAGDLVEAEKRLRGVLDRAPGLELPDIYSISYEIRRSKGDRSGGREVLEKAMEAFPARESFKISFVEELKEEGDWEGAAEACRRFLEEDGRLTAAWIMLGDIDMNRGRVDEAIDNFRRALSLEPGNAMVSVKYAGALAARGDLPQAEALLKELRSQPGITRTGDYSMAVSDLGLKLLFSGDREKGMSWIREACALTPEDPMAWINRGVAHFVERDFEQAMSHYRKALDLDRTSALAHSNIGILFLARFAEEHDPSLLDRAMASLNRAVDYDPGLASAYTGRGSVHLSWGDLARAVKDYERAIELDPGQGDAYVNAALALQLMERYDEALGYLDRFKERFYRWMPPPEREELDRLYQQIKAMKGNS